MKKKEFYKSHEQILKNPIFSKTARPSLMTKIYIIEGTKEAMR